MSEKGFPPGFQLDPFQLIGIKQEDLKNAGYNPAQVIVPAWFGFKTNFTEVPDSYPIYITGRSQFKLFVNGTAVLFGPCRGTKDELCYDTIDIAGYLKAGENKLVLQVLSYPEKPGDRLNVGPNYCYGDNDGPAVMIKPVNGELLGDQNPSDGNNWKIWLDRSMSFNNHAVFLTGANECVDFKALQKNPLFGEKWEDSSLLEGVVVQPLTYDPFGCRHGRVFTKRPIPLLSRTEKTIPNWEEKVIPAHSNISFVLDAGELTTAYFRVGFFGGKGSTVRFTYAESYFHKDENGKEYKGVRDDATGYIDGVYDEVKPNGEWIYEPFRFRTFRFIKVDVATEDEPLTITPKAYIETTYPLINSKRPVFTDPQKEKLYDVAFRTLQLCAHDTYEDCPYYEQLQYACDTRLEILFTYAATDDKALPARAIELFAASIQPNGFLQARFPSREDQIIPVFSLYFVLMLEDWVNAGGDIQFIRRFIPTAERVIENFLEKRCKDGCIAPRGYWDYFDWTKEWTATIASTPTAVLNGESALQNLFFVSACQSFARVLPKVNRADLAEYYLNVSKEILAAVEKNCYDEEKGLYREGPETNEFSQHTQIYAVLTGLAEGDKAKALMEKVLEDESLIQCSFVQRFYLFRALEKAGMYDRTSNLWQTWQEFIDLHCTTFPETQFDPRSDCHGWSALPLYELAK